MAIPRVRRVYCSNCHVLANCNGATTQDNQWEDMIKQMSPINHVVLSPPTVVQAIPDVGVLRDMMDIIIDHLKWIDTLMCVCA
jgi:hypothetical protein